MDFKGIWETKGFTPSFTLMLTKHEEDTLSGYLSFSGAPVRIAEIQGGMVIEGKLHIPFQELSQNSQLISGNLTATPSEDGNTLEGSINIGSGTDREDKPVTLTRKINAAEPDQTS